MKQYNFKSDNYCYRKVGRAITIWGAIEKVQYCYRNIGEMDNLSAPKIIAHFGCTNIIFADCTFCALLYPFPIFYPLSMHLLFFPFLYLSFSLSLSFLFLSLLPLSFFPFHFIIMDVFVLVY